MNHDLLQADYKANVVAMNQQLRLNDSFDINSREIHLGHHKATLYSIDGFVKDDVMEKIMEFLMDVPADKQNLFSTAMDFSALRIPYVEASYTDSISQAVTAMLSGTVGMLVEGLSQCLLIDARTYPGRSVSEPEDDRVLRGAHDGFVETLIFNTALIRRHIRDPRLTMKIHSIGSSSKTDVVLCFHADRVPPQLLDALSKRLSCLSVDALTMSQESLAECLLKPQWWNPFPRIRYTERPDAAAASIMEGSILLIVDNSPSVMIFPTSLLDFVQDTNDFYFPPLVGSYLRLVRMTVFLLTLLLTPIWYLFLKNPQWIPSWLEFIRVSSPNSVPVFAQLLLVELVIDGLKLASLNTPSVLSNSFSVVAALILGDFAVKANWLVPEVVLYMAFVAIASFTLPSVELGYALKFFRTLLLILTGLFNLPGFFLGMGLLLATLFGTRTIDGQCYLYPLIPFNGKALRCLLFRLPIEKSSN